MFWLFFALLFLIASPAEAAEQVVKITNFSSNSLPEWVEIQNQSTTLVDLTNWKIKDSNSVTSDDLTLTGCLSPGSYLTVYHATNWLNDSGDTITLLGSNNLQLDQVTYTTGRVETSPRSDNTCTPTATPTVTPSNTPTSTPTNAPTQTPSTTPTPSNTPTPTNTPAPTSVASATPKPSNTPIPTPSEAPIIEPTSATTIVEPPSPTEGIDGLGMGDIITPTSPPTKSGEKLAISPTMISLIFISVGCLLLFVPIIIIKFKK